MRNVRPIDVRLTIIDNYFFMDLQSWRNIWPECIFVMRHGTWHTHARAHTCTHAHMHTVPYTIVYLYAVSCDMDENTLRRRRYVSPFSHLASVLPFYFSISAIPSYLETQVLLPISQRDVGSISDRGAEITEPAEANVRQPFSGPAGWLPAGSLPAGRGRGRGRGRGGTVVPSRIPISTKYKIWKVFSANIIVRWSNAFLLRRSERDCPRC